MADPGIELMGGLDLLALFPKIKEGGSGEAGTSPRSATANCLVVYKTALCKGSSLHSG